MCIRDRYQLLQACIVGADAVLLIASCLSPEQCSTLTAEAHELGLEGERRLNSEMIPVEEAARACFMLRRCV